MNTQLANRLTEVFLSGKWIATTNWKEQLTGLPWEHAVMRIENLNSIAMLTFHVNYYLNGLVQVFEGGNLELKDSLSFEMPEIRSQQDWDNLVFTFLENAERFIAHVAQLDDNTLNKVFVKEAYGTYLRNIEAQIEHAYYHLGQVSLIAKLIRQGEG